MQPSGRDPVQGRARQPGGQYRVGWPAEAQQRALVTQRMHVRWRHRGQCDQGFPEWTGPGRSLQRQQEPVPLLGRRARHPALWLRVTRGITLSSVMPCLSSSITDRWCVALPLPAVLHVGLVTLPPTS